MRNWWERFKAWLGLSEPGNRKEEFEDWLETNQPVFAALHAEQQSQREGRGGFRQLRRQDRHLSSMPVWSDMQIDVYEAPVERKAKSTQFGYTYTYTVTERDGVEWTLTVDPEVPSPLVWMEVKKLLP